VVAEAEAADSFSAAAVQRVGRELIQVPVAVTVVKAAVYFAVRCVQVVVVGQGVILVLVVLEGIPPPPHQGLLAPGALVGVADVLPLLILEMVRAVAGLVF
jgi:hypothetical protein